VEWREYLARHIRLRTDRLPPSSEIVGYRLKLAIELTSDGSNAKFTDLFRIVGKSNKRLPLAAHVTAHRKVLVVT
jgi:hypothetical protein